MVLRDDHPDSDQRRRVRSISDQASTHIYPVAAGGRSPGPATGGPTSTGSDL